MQIIQTGDIFQSTLPRRERLPTQLHRTQRDRFQSTLPRRERQLWWLWLWQALLFQSTLPRRERPCSGSERRGVLYFNPRSREGSDGTLKNVYRHAMISIHAPAKGATLIPETFIYAIRISIHAPAKGATFAFSIIVNFLAFQSTLPRRERPRTGDRETTASGISIHAPAKGATLSGWKMK